MDGDSKADDGGWEVMLYNALIAGDLESVKTLASEHDIAQQRLLSFMTEPGSPDEHDTCNCGRKFELDVTSSDSILLGSSADSLPVYSKWLQQKTCPCLEDDVLEELELETEAVLKRYASISCLDAAVRSGNPQLVKYLLEELKCPASDTTEQTGCNAIHTALRLLIYFAAQFPVISDELLEEVPEDSVITKSNQVQEHFIEILHLLVEHGCDINLRDQSAPLKLLGGFTPLALAFQQGADPDLMKMLIELGADVNLPSSNGVSLLQGAVALNDPSLVEAVLAGDCKDFDQKMNELLGPLQEFYPLHVAILKDNFLIVEMLLEKGADPDVFGDDHTAMMWCALYDHLNMAKSLLKHGCDIDLRNKNGYKALHYAAWRGHKDICILLMQHGAKQEQTDDKNTPLALACHGNRHEIVELFLEQPCDVDNADKDEDTPMHYVAYNGALETMGRLLECGADLDPQNSVGATPLWMAVYFQKGEVSCKLVEHGANLHIKTRGVDPRATQGQDDEQVVYCYDDPKSLLYVACDRGTFDVVPTLVLAGTNLSQEEWLVQGNYPAKLEGLDPRTMGVVTFLSHHLRHPPSLLRLCRTKVRSMVGWSRLQSIESLQIPATLHKFLLLKKL